MEAVPVSVRLRAEEIVALDQWISDQGIPLSRPTAIRAIVRQATGIAGRKKR